MELSLKTSLVILAGGAGRRLGGVVKPLLEDEAGTTLIAHQLARLGSIAETVYVVAPASLWSALRPVIGDAELVADDAQGPAAAVIRGARASSADRLFVVGGDLVRFDEALAATLLAKLSPDVDAVVPVVGDYRQSMFAAYDRRALIAAAGAPSMRGLLRALRTLEVEATGIEDVDDEADAARWKLHRP